jgi:hypothetical protein
MVEMILPNDTTGESKVGRPNIEITGRCRERFSSHEN